MPKGNPDGSIMIETKLGTEQFEKGLKRLSQMTTPTVNDLTKRIGKVSSLTETVSKSANKAADSFSSVQKEADSIELDRLLRDLDNVNAQIENQERLLDDLRSQYQRALSIGGAESPRALELEKQILKAEAAMNKLQDKSDDTARKIWEIDDAAENAADSLKETASTAGDAADASKELADAAGNAGDKTEDLGDKAEKTSGKLGGSKKTVSGLTLVLSDLAAKGITAAVSAMKDLYNQAEDMQQGMAMIQTSAQAAGVGTRELQNRLLELNRVSEDSGANVEALSNLMYAGFKGDSLAAVVEQLSGAVVAFPDTMKLESLADSIQETIATGEATGQFAELLGRVGVSAEDFEKKMSRASGETGRQQLIINTLARTDLPLLYKAYQTNNRGLIENRDAQFEYNQALLIVAQQAMPIVSEVLQGLTNLLREHGDEVGLVIGIVGDLASTVLGIVSVLAGVPAPVWAIISAIVVGVTAFAKINSAIDKATGLFGSMPKVVSALQSPLTMTTVKILAVVAALVALAAIIAVIMGRSSDLNSAMNNIGNAVGKISGQVNNAGKGVGGYASGTTSASPGLHWVGENGPELLWFNGGEAITTAAQSRIIAKNLQLGAERLTTSPISKGIAGSNAAPVRIDETNYNFGEGSVVIDPKGIKDLEGFAQVLERERNRRQDTQMGVSARRIR